MDNETEILEGRTYTGRKFEFIDGQWRIWDEETGEQFKVIEIPPLTVRQKD